METARKWGRRLLWVLPALLALYGVVMLADAVWFRTQIPVGFLNANWSGSWRTDQYRGFSGRLLVRLPDPLSENEDFAAEALVYYPIYCAWRTGQFVKMDFTGHFSPDAPASAGQSTRAPPEGGGKLKFKGVAGSQVVEYVALLDPSCRRIVGGYLSRGPYDYGSFAIRYY
jgi:hypothetical protein